MKHTFKTTFILVMIFFAAQIIGLAIASEYIDHETTAITGNITEEALPLGMERPPVDQPHSYLYIVIAVLVGTLLVFLLIRFKKTNIWRVWFLLAVVLGLTIAFSPFLRRWIPAGGENIALVLALVLGIWKVYKPNIFIHNFTELFVYGGIAALFVSMPVYSVLILLLLISGYDMYAVWKSKHMITLAKFQNTSKVFAGILIPYKEGKQPKKISKAEKSAKMVKGDVQTAILGGGDIAFPLIFADVVMRSLILENTFAVGFLKSLIIPVFAAISLFLLLYLAKKDKFYPAMPFLTAGCLVGYGILMLI